MEEAWIQKAKDDMEYEAMDTIRELRDYAEHENIECEFILERFIQSFHMYKDKAQNIEEEMNRRWTNDSQRT